MGNRSPLSHLPVHSAEVPGDTTRVTQRDSLEKDSKVIVEKIPNSGEVINEELAVPPGKQSLDTYRDSGAQYAHKRGLNEHPECSDLYKHRSYQKLFKF